MQLEIDDKAPGNIIDGETPIFLALACKYELRSIYLWYMFKTLIKVFSFPVKKTSSGITSFKAPSIAALAAAAVFMLLLFLLFFISRKSKSEKSHLRF